MSNEPKHTATPWRVVEHNDKNETDIISDDYFIAQAKHYSDDDITFERLVMIESKVKRIKDTNQSTGRANAARIVQCVNACEGLNDPEKEIKIMRELESKFKEDLKRANERGDSNRKMMVEQSEMNVIMKRELESLRAENAELIEALRWHSVNDKLPEPLETVWISNGNGWTTLGCLVVNNEGSHWAESNGIIYQEENRIVSECESDDLDVKFWIALPKPPQP